MLDTEDHHNNPVQFFGTFMREMQQQSMQNLVGGINTIAGQLQQNFATSQQHLTDSMRAGQLQMAQQQSESHAALLSVVMTHQSQQLQVMNQNQQSMQTTLANVVQCLAHVQTVQPTTAGAKPKAPHATPPPTSPPGKGPPPGPFPQG